MRLRQDHEAPAAGIGVVMVVDNGAPVELIEFQLHAEK